MLIMVLLMELCASGLWSSSGALGGELLGFCWITANSVDTGFYLLIARHSVLEPWNLGVNSLENLLAFEIFESL